MKYILNENFALRSWTDFPYGLLDKNRIDAIKLYKSKFYLLKKCDGCQDIENNDLLNDLLKENIIREASENDKLSEWQKYKRFNNLYVPTIFLRVTGVCNFSCKHCFNAADINKDFSKWTLDEFKVLIKEAKEIGVHSFKFTGGEPLLNPDLLDMIKEIYANDMMVYIIATNAYFFNQKFFDELAKIGCKTIFGVSFDCLGHHDWMRGQEGTEKKCLENIKLAIKNNHKTMVNAQVNKVTADSLLETAEYLESIGVYQTRFIRTTETPRWLKYANDASLGIYEYFDVCIDFLKKFYSKPRKMMITFWKVGRFYSGSKQYKIASMFCNEDEYNDNIVLCSQRKYQKSIGSDGSLYPCHQISGAYDLVGIKFPNVKEIGLKKAIQDPEYIKHSCMTAGEFIEIAEDNNNNSEYLELAGRKEGYEYEIFNCKTCKHFKQCLGGCRAIGYTLSGSLGGPDLTNCLFYKGKYYEKVKEALPADWTNHVEYCDDASYHESDPNNNYIGDCLDEDK